MSGFFVGLGAIPVCSTGLFLPREGDSWLPLLLLCLAASLLAYLCGSVNSAVLVSRALFGKDVREYGSKNAGLTNMLRVFGKRGAVLTLIGDMLKAVVAITLGLLLCGYEYGGFFAFFFCIVGHAFPCFFGFRGGKGVLCAATGILCLSPVTFLSVIAIFLLMVLTTKMVSVGSVSAAFFFPLFLKAFFGTLPFPVLSMCLLSAVLVIYLHRENIRRLIRGEEKKLGQREAPGDAEK